MKYFRSRASCNVFSMFAFLVWVCLLFALPGQYVLYLYTRREGCLDSYDIREVKGPRSTDTEVSQQIQGYVKEKDGTADESTIFIVPRHKQPKWVPYVPVKNRNKFEALFRDFESLNVVPEGLSDSDKLVKDADRKGRDKPWELFYQDINRYQLYSYNNTALLDSLFTYLQDSPMKICQQMPGGTQIKLNITFFDGGQGLMKPWRILDFRRVPPVTGRIFNITSEIKPTANDKDLKKSFFTSPANNTCFITHCLQYCEISKTPVCGQPDMVEGSVCTFLPKWREARRKVWANPWKQSYTRTQRNAPWEKDPTYCQSVVMKDPLYQTGRRMLDVIDLTIFDFFIGNLDRHSYNTFKMFGNFTSLLLFDHGRADKCIEGIGNPVVEAARSINTEVTQQTQGTLNEKNGNPVVEAARSINTEVTQQTQGTLNEKNAIRQVFGFLIQVRVICGVPREYETLPDHYFFADIERHTAEIAAFHLDRIRRSTYERLLILNRQEYLLGDVMRESLSMDPIAPVLYEPHYEALNRRLRIVLEHIDRCLAKAQSPEDVLKQEPKFENN
ncbi:Extracellular serine/threonine protein kinase FAM20C [Holothuria leucospilota]|uniref:Extracellular serine/threonine protein kinase FAM20C n=1 Tax=Holothuria leucospilota TaxID=206669 RepID=A0A9Q1H8S8_HOLLE|nr:Extracellular serine/threonine protein kinase FAM20C [Holothuria leucospilota]